jgi:ribose transport system substrate-binding protein
VKDDKLKEAKPRGRTRAFPRHARIPVASAVVATLALGMMLTSAEARPGAAGATIPASTLTSLQHMVTAAEAIPKWTAPGPAVSASSVKGASMTVFPVNSEIDACNTQTKDFAALGKTLGANVKAQSNSGNPAQWVNSIQSATAEKDKAIVMLCGVIPGAVGPQLTAAHNAGAKIIDGNYNETTNYAGLDGETNVNVIEGMQDDVADALVNLKGAPLHALLVTSSSIVQGPASITAVKGEIAKVCSSTCSEQTVDVPIQDWATATEGDVSSALVANSSINAVIIAFDGMTPFAMPAVEKHSGLKIYTWGGGRSVVKLMQATDPVVMSDPAPDEQWDAYDAMDQVIRLLGGHPAASVNKEIDPNRFWTPSNVAQFFGPGGSYGNQGYGGNAFMNGFLKLWGVK